MALPIIHGAAGYLIHRRNHTLGHGIFPGVIAVLVANLADFDFLVGFAIGKPGIFHRGFSHTVLAGMLFGLLAGLCYQLLTKKSWLKPAVVFSLLYISHLVIDLFTVDARGPHGAQFLWPFSDAYFISPVTIFGEILVDGRARIAFLGTVFSLDAVTVMVRDAGLAAVAIGGVSLWGWLWRSRGASRVESACWSRDESPLGGDAAGITDPGLAYAEVEAEGSTSQPRRSRPGGEFDDPGSVV